MGAEAEGRRRGRYGKVEKRMWTDSKFIALSDRAKLLWNRLLTGPETSNLPGLIVAGRLQLAEAMGWSPESFDEAFAELSSKGMAKADWKLRVILVPKAINYNLPQSPNVVLSWQEAWDATPDSNLKSLALARLSEALAMIGESFTEALQKLSESFRKASPNQEQEQEQYQEQEKKHKIAPPSGAPSPVDPVVKSDPGPKRESWITPYADAWKERTGGDMSIEKSLRPLSKIRSAYGDERALRAWRRFLSEEELRFLSAATFAEKFKAWDGPPPRAPSERRGPSHPPRGGFLNVAEKNEAAIADFEEMTNGR